MTLKGFSSGADKEKQKKAMKKNAMDQKKNKEGPNNLIEWKKEKVSDGLPPIPNLSLKVEEIIF